MPDTWQVLTTSKLSHIGAGVCTCRQVQTPWCVCALVGICMSVHVCTLTGVHVFVPMSVCVCICLWTRLCELLCVCVCVHVQLGLAFLPSCGPC